MVVFACNACGASVKKNQVEKHYQTQCRRCESVSCMDCGKDFWGEEYQNHVKCVTEEEKYSAKGWQPRPGTNKGERKQEAWIEAINRKVAATTDMSPALKQLLSTLTSYSNIPRKKKKFLNFVTNSVRVRSQELVEQAWSVFEAATAEPQAAASGQERETPAEDSSVQTAGAAETGVKRRRDSTVDVGNGEETKSTKKKKKRAEEAGESAVNGAANGTDETNGVERVVAEPTSEDIASPRFNWQGTVTQILRAREGQCISLKKLRKKVVSHYQGGAWAGDVLSTEEEICAKLDKRLKKMAEVAVSEGQVSLVAT